MPTLNNYSKKFIVKSESDPCVSVKCKGIDWVECYMSECRVVSEALEKLANVQCSYRDLIYVDDFNYVVGSPTLVEGDKAYLLRASDYVKIKCWGRRHYRLFSTSWKGYGFGIRSTAKRLAPLLHRERSYNVIIVGIDSVSRNEFFRQLPMSVEQLRKMDAVILNGYNIVGDATPAALFPILTGKTELEMPDARKGILPAHYLDEFPFIFYKLRKDGYRTAFFEDRPAIGTFQHRFRGFRQPPTDFYSRALYLDVDKYAAWDNVCFGSKTKHAMLLNVTDQFMHLDGKKFGFTWMVAVNHDDEDTLYAADEDMTKFLSDFVDHGWTADTLVIIMGDHGHRFSSKRQYLQGKLEERLPFMAIIIPEDMKRARPDAWSMLRRNADVLTTPHDIHATVLDAIGLSKYANRYKVPGTDLKRGISLFEQIPRSRSCGEAGVLSHWCACVNWVPISKEDPIFTRLANELMNSINAIIRPAQSLCAFRSLNSTEWVMVAKPRRQLVEYQGVAVSDGLMSVFGTNEIEILKERYQVKIVTSPGYGVFEATVMYEREKDKFSLSSQDISRTSAYGTEPECVDDVVHLRKFCYCIE